SAELCLSKSRLVSMAASLWCEGKSLAEEWQDIVLETEGDIAGMGARIDLETVGDAIAVEHVVQLAGVGAQAVLVPDIQGNGAVAVQVGSILVQQCQGCVRGPFRQHSLLLISQRQIQIQRRVAGIGRPGGSRRQLGPLKEGELFGICR